MLLVGIYSAPLCSCMINIAKQQLCIFYTTCTFYIWLLWFIAKIWLHEVECRSSSEINELHDHDDDIMIWKWPKHFPHYWHFVWESTGHCWSHLMKSPVMGSDSAFFVVNLNELLNKWSKCWWFWDAMCMWLHPNFLKIHFLVPSSVILWSLWWPWNVMW